MLLIAIQCQKVVLSTVLILKELFKKKKKGCKAILFKISCMTYGAVTDTLSCVT